MSRVTNRAHLGQPQRDCCRPRTPIHPSYSRFRGGKRDANRGEVLTRTRQLPLAKATVLRLSVSLSGRLLRLTGALAKPSRATRRAGIGGAGYRCFGSGSDRTEAPTFRVRGRPRWLIDVPGCPPGPTYANQRGRSHPGAMGRVERRRRAVRGTPGSTESAARCRRVHSPRGVDDRDCSVLVRCDLWLCAHAVPTL